MHYSFHRKCDTFTRITIGRIGLAEVVSQDHTLHMIALDLHNQITHHRLKTFELSKIKALLLAETHLLLESNPL